MSKHELPEQVEAAAAKLPLAETGVGSVRPPVRRARRRRFAQAAATAAVVLSLGIAAMILGARPGERAALDPSVAPGPPPTVTALASLTPEGEVVTLAAPYGSGDARVAKLLADRGDRVAEGETVALLDNLPQLEAAVETSRTLVRVREAGLVQARALALSNLREAEATVGSARASVALARQTLERSRTLQKRGVVSNATLDSAIRDAAAADRELARADAVASRYAGARDGTQPDVVVAEANLAAARADFASAERDLANGRVVSPIDGTVLDIIARLGERPGEAGVATIARTDAMTAEIEVYQTDVRRLSIGQAVSLRAEALGDVTLNGRVTFVGLDVGRQTLVDDDPAANTDARVVRVTAALDARSGEVAARFINLEVVATVDVSTGPLVAAGEGRAP